MRILQILLDKRQPFFVPYHYINTLLLRKKINKAVTPRQIFILLTFDVENSWGDEEQESQKENEIFLKIIQEIRSSNSTFFLPGNLVAGLKTTLKQVAEENEIGLHGHHHELWRSAHFVDKKPVKDVEKISLLEDSLREFERNGVPSPYSFRAPYMWCKRSDLKLLGSMGFKVDSSDPSQLGMTPARNNGEIIRIPITAGPLPYFKKRSGLIYTRFRLFNMKLLRECNDRQFIEQTNQIVKMQHYLKQVPHLVFMAHSWEFYERAGETKDENYYCSHENYKILRSKFELLEKNYSVRYVTVNAFRRLLKKQNHIH